MELTELEDETLKRFCMVWMALNSEWQKRRQSELQKRLKGLQDPFTGFMSTVMEQVQKKNQSFFAESFSRAVRSGNLDLCVSDLATDEAMEASAKEMIAQLGSPPGLEKESLITEMKRMHSLFSFSSANLTLRDLLKEMQSVLEIAEELGDNFEEIAPRRDCYIEYLKRRFRPEEYRRVSDEKLEEQINQFLGFAKSQIELLSFHPAFQGMPQKQVERRKTVIRIATERRARKLRKAYKGILEEEINEVWGGERESGKLWRVMLRRIKRLLLRDRMIPWDLQRAFEEFRGPEKGIRFDIIGIEDWPFGSAILMQPSRQLSEDERKEISTYVKIRLYCEIPRAVAALNDKSLKLVRDGSPVASTEDEHGNVFALPAWWVQYPGGMVGPLYFVTDWDKERGLFGAVLKKLIDQPSEHLVANRETGQIVALSGPLPVIGRIARGFQKGVGSIEI